jgi:hypothetical protein
MPIAPWLNPPNFIGAMSAGADAGNAIAARAQREREQQAERADRMMALEVERQQAGEAMAFKRDMAQRESAQAAQDDLLKREMAGMNLRSTMAKIEAEKEADRQRSGLQLGIASERSMMDRARLALEAQKADSMLDLNNRRLAQDEKKQASVRSGLSKRPEFMEMTPDEKATASILSKEVQKKGQAVEGQSWIGELYGKKAKAFEKAKVAYNDFQSNFYKNRGYMDDKSADQMLEVHRARGDDVDSAIKKLIANPDLRWDFNKTFGWGTAEMVFRKYGMPALAVPEISTDQRSASNPVTVSYTDTDDSYAAVP